MELLAHTFSEKFVKLKNNKSDFLDLNGITALDTRFLPGQSVKIFEMKFNLAKKTSKVTGRFLVKTIKSVEEKNIHKKRIFFE